MQSMLDVVMLSVSMSCSGTPATAIDDNTALVVANGISTSSSSYSSSSSSSVSFYFFFFFLKLLFLDVSCLSKALAILAVQTVVSCS